MHKHFLFVLFSKKQRQMWSRFFHIENVAIVLSHCPFFTSQKVMWRVVWAIFSVCMFFSPIQRVFFSFNPFKRLQHNYVININSVLRPIPLSLRNWRQNSSFFLYCVCYVNIEFCWTRTFIPFRQYNDFDWYRFCWFFLLFSNEDEKIDLFSVNHTEKKFYRFYSFGHLCVFFVASGSSQHEAYATNSKRKLIKIDAGFG